MADVKEIAVVENAAEVVADNVANNVEVDTDGKGSMVKLFVGAFAVGAMFAFGEHAMNWSINKVGNMIEARVQKKLAKKAAKEAAKKAKEAEENDDFFADENVSE